MPAQHSSTPPLPGRRPPVTLRAIDDAALLADLHAAAHLKRTTPRALVADIIRQNLGPQFAPQVAA